MDQDNDLSLFIAYALDEATAHDRARLEARLEADPEAADKLQRVQRMIRSLSSEELRDLPAPLHQALCAIFAQNAAAARPSWIDAAARVLLTLLSDTRTAPAGGFRNWGHDSFLLTYAGLGINVDVQLTPAPAGPDAAGRWELRGCAETDGLPQPVDVALVPQGAGERRPPMVTASDEHGQFTLEVPEGAFMLAVNNGKRVFATPPFDVP